MLLNVVDANGAIQQVSVPSPGTAEDASGVILADLPSGPGPYTYQELLPASPGSTRGGWWFRNRGFADMFLTEDGTDPSSSNTAILVKVGELYPPPGVGYPVTQGAVLLAGQAGDAFSAKEW